MQKSFTKGKNKSGVSLVDNNLDNAGDICYPFISGKSHYYFDSTGSNTPVTKTDTPSRNVKPHSSNNGISLVDLKPAIRIYHIIKAIEENIILLLLKTFLLTLIILLLETM